jgi:hypothetical protein
MHDFYNKPTLLFCNLIKFYSGKLHRNTVHCFRFDHHCILVILLFSKTLSCQLMPAYIIPDCIIFFSLILIYKVFGHNKIFINNLRNFYIILTTEIFKNKDVKSRMLFSSAFGGKSRSGIFTPSFPKFLCSFITLLLIKIITVIMIITQIRKE